MVSLDHQNFWQPAQGISAKCSSDSAKTQTTGEVRQLDALEQRTEAEGYILESNVPEEEHNEERSGGLVRASSPDRYPDDAASSAGNYPDYPEDVALYPSSVSDAPSVTGLYATRVFDIFQEDRIEERDGSCGRKSGKRALEDTCISSPKRRRVRASTVTNAQKPRKRRASLSGAGDSPFENAEDPSASNLAGLRNTIGYLKRAYSVATAEANFDDDLAGADVRKENLAVLQLSIKTLQHAYGIVATSTTSMENPAQEPKTVQRRPTITRSRWTVEDDRRLLRLRESQNLSWKRIGDLFPERTLNAIRTRYFRESSKVSEPPSSKENHSGSICRQAKTTPSIRRSTRLSQSRHVKDRRSDKEYERRYPSRASKPPSGSTTLELDSIDPRLRSLNDV